MVLSYSRFDTHVLLILMLQTWFHDVSTMILVIFVMFSKNVSMLESSNYFVMFQKMFQCSNNFVMFQEWFYIATMNRWMLRHEICFRLLYMLQKRNNRCYNNFFPWWNVASRYLFQAGMYVATYKIDVVGAFLSDGLLQHTTDQSNFLLHVEMFQYAKCCNVTMVRMLRWDFFYYSMS